jgi:hypothetical protein
VGACTLFALSRTRAQRQKRVREQEEKKAEKAKAPSAKEKALIRAFFPFSGPHWKPDSRAQEPKAAWKGESKGRE